MNSIGKGADGTITDDDNGSTNGSGNGTGTITGDTTVEIGNFGNLTGGTLKEGPTVLPDDQAGTI